MQDSLFDSEQPTFLQFTSTDLSDIVFDDLSKGQRCPSKTALEGKRPHFRDDKLKLNLTYIARTRDAGGTSGGFLAESVGSATIDQEVFSKD